MWKFLAEASVLQCHQLSEQDVTTARLLGIGDMKAKETPAGGYQCQFAMLYSGSWSELVIKYQITQLK
jgi:hypothetical protein